mgnify:CR=1 FL=1
MENGGLVTTLLGVILTAIFSQSIAVWVKFSNLEKKITENKCPFGQCPLYERARSEAVNERKLPD